MMNKSKPPPAEVYAPTNPPDYQMHGYPQHGYQPGPQHGYHPPGPHQSYPPVSYQPTTQSTNVVVNMAGGDGGGDSQGRPWTTNVCGCCEDIETCLCAWLLPPCFLARLAMQLDECMCTPFCVPEGLMAMRIKVRAANGIRGSICEDCICTTFCPLLTMCQMKRELDNIALKKPGTRL